MFTLAGTVYVQRNFTIIHRVVPIAWTNMVCTGNEDTISECRYSGVDGNLNCDHSYDIALRCNGKIYMHPCGKYIPTPPSIFQCKFSLKVIVYG